MRPFPALKGLPPYVFAEIHRLKAEALAAGREIIDLGMGNPDMPPPAIVIDALREAAALPSAHRYSDSRGIAELREAQARYYRRRFGVDVDPEREVITTLGSKEGIATLARTITAPGDAALVPDPCYPIHAFAFVMAGGEVMPLPSAFDDAQFRAAEAAIGAAARKPIAMIVNSPSNPTTEVASFDFLREAVRFCTKHDLLLLSDLAYAEIYFGEEAPHSIFEVPGAKDVAVEFTSVSKTFSMAGWRIGFAVGTERVISAMARVKSYLDYGGFEPIQRAAIIALDHAEEAGAEVRALYRRRRDAFIAALNEAGVEAKTPEASMFCWLPLPPSTGGSLAFAERAMSEAGVAVSPGIGFGPEGDGFVRIALIADEERLEKAARALAPMLRTSIPVRARQDA